MPRLKPSTPAAKTAPADATTVADAIAAAGDAATFAEIRAAMPAAKRARFTDGMIHQAIIDAGRAVDIEL